MSGTATAPLREGIPLGIKSEAPVLIISDLAKQKIREVLQAQSGATACIRISCRVRGRYTMGLEPDGKVGVDDTIIPYEGFQVFVDAASYSNVTGASLDYKETAAGAGFQFTAPVSTAPPKPQPKPAPEGPEGDIWRQIQALLDDQVNPAVASHGGNIRLMEYREGIAYIEMSGGCQGCGQAKVTVKQGVERLLQSTIPEVLEVLDVTDHAGGRNPYYTS